MDKANQTVTNNLIYIDFCLMFRGHIGVEDIQQEFDLEASHATQLLDVYTQEWPGNLEFEENSKRFFQTKAFNPAFEHQGREILNRLTSKSNLIERPESVYPVQGTSYINVPDLNVLARLVQAMLNGNVVNIIYTSLSSGSSSREIVPHQILDNGLRWHVRAYDRKSESFRDFVLTRISKVTVKSNRVFQHELADVDWQWQKEITLILKPHPVNVVQPTAIEMDYGMLDGEKRIVTRAAIAGYLLRRWNVDISAEAKLKDHAHQLWLSNRHQLNDVESLIFAPGF